jgi:hypothetical protein
MLHEEENSLNKLQLECNLRGISQYNLEQLKERLRGFTESVFT